MDITICVSSHRDYAPVTLPRLIPQLLDSGIKKSDIFVTIAECSQNQTKKFNDIELREVTHNSFEFTSMIEFMRRPQVTSHMFLMHDTCDVGVGFKNLINVGSDFEHVSVDPEGFTSMGLYATSFLKEMTAFLYGLENLSKIRAMLVEKMLKRMSISSTYNVALPDRQPATDIYGDGILRVSQYYPQCDLTKHIGNYDSRAGTIFAP